MKSPLLLIDGDSFAHRAYHALPKTIRRKDNRGGGAIVGFGNFLLRLFKNERPRAVLVGWDTLGAPTYRHRLFPSYQSGRQFDDELVEQLEVLPQFAAACGFANAKAPGYEADDFLAAAVATEEQRGGCTVVATGDRDAFQLASELTTILQPIRAGEMARIGPAEVHARYGVEPKQVPDFIALRGDPSDELPGARGIGPKGPPLCCEPTGRWKTRCSMVVFLSKPTSCGNIAASLRWIPLRLSLPWTTSDPPGGRRLHWRTNWDSTDCRTD